MGVQKDAAHLNSKLSHMGLELRKEVCAGEKHLLVISICKVMEIIRNTAPSRESSENRKGPRKLPNYGEPLTLLNRKHLKYTSYTFGYTQ